jgi:hypothetical protein
MLLFYSYYKIGQKKTVELCRQKEAKDI